MIQTTKKQYRETHSDYKGKIDGKPTVLTMDKPTGATVLAFVEFVDEKGNPIKTDEKA